MGFLAFIGMSWDLLWDFPWEKLAGKLSKRYHFGLMAGTLGDLRQLTLDTLGITGSHWGCGYPPCIDCIDLYR